MGLDVGNVLADVTTSLLAETARVWGVSCAEEELAGPNWLQRRVVDAGHDPGRVFRWFRHVVADPGFILALKPVNSAQSGWKGLSGLPIELRIVSDAENRPETVQATLRWLDMHGFSARCDFTREKAGWCRQVRADWFVDDDPDPKTALEEAKTRILLLDRPYNKDLALERVFSLLDVCAIVCHALESR